MLGATGKEGPTGKEGALGATNVVTRYGPKLALPTGSAGVSYAACLQGEAVTGGGFDFPEGHPIGTNYFVDADRPSIVAEVFPGRTFYRPPENGHAATGWAVAMENKTGSTFNYQSYVQCAAP
jgi:hypothetical protein